jgi:hypothetical protein
MEMVVVHVQVVTYRMTGLSEPEFVEANNEFAEMMAAVPGLLVKVWLKGADASVYGGLYLWQDREAYEGFVAGELWAEAVKDDSVLDLASHDFGVMDQLTRMTQPALKVL